MPVDAISVFTPGARFLGDILLINHFLFDIIIRKQFELSINANALNQ